MCVIYVVGIVGVYMDMVIVPFLMNYCELRVVVDNGAVGFLDAIGDGGL